MKRLLVNDCLTCIPGTTTFWHDLREWFDMYFVGGDYKELADIADDEVLESSQSIDPTKLIVRNASWFPPMKRSDNTPTISILQDIMEDGPGREMQKAVMERSTNVVFNSLFTESKYMPGRVGVDTHRTAPCFRIIPLPVDFSLFEPGNPMGLQQALSLPDGCVCWVGAHEGAAGHIKGYDVFLSLVRQNPDLSFVAVFKDSIPDVIPPNMRAYCRVTQEELVKIMGACRVGLCTSRTETQHLAGIEMGACGLPIVASCVGVYWERGATPGRVILEPSVSDYATQLRDLLKDPGDPQQIRSYWQKEFDRPVIRAAWEKLISEVENT